MSDGTGISLRPFRPTDTTQLSSLFTDPETALWNPGPAAAEVVAWSASSGAGTDHRTWAVADAADDRLLGTVSLFRLDLDQVTAEVGYRVLPAERGRGIATAALLQASRRGFHDLGLQRISLLHAISNVPSCRVARAAGFSLEGVLRSSYRYGDGLRHDEHLHARLRTDPAR